MTQLGMFDAPVALVDNERGRVTYHANVVSIAAAERWFARLRDGVDWHSRKRVMYEREVDVPRLTAHFPLARIAAGTAEAIDAGATEALREALACVERVAPAPYNSVGLNYYRDGNDSVAPHNDRLTDLVKGEPISLISLGDTRRMLIRSKRPGEPAVPIDLAAGSVLVMSWSSQLHYTHGIAKTKQLVGPRMSLAFRVRPAD